MVLSGIMNCNTFSVAPSIFSENAKTYCSIVSRLAVHKTSDMFLSLFTKELQNLCLNFTMEFFFEKEKFFGPVLD
jgi:hypothetical protein